MIDSQSARDKPMEHKELIEKIQALMQMTTERGASESEAEIAARKISELLVKYNLDLAEVKNIEVDDEMDMGFPRDINARGKKVWHMNTPMPEWLHHLATAIGRLNFCEVVGNNMAIYLGLKRDVQIAEYMFETLIYQLRQQAVAAHK